MLPDVDAVVDSGAHTKLGRCFGKASGRVQDIGNDRSDGRVWVVYILPTAVCIYGVGNDKIALSLTGSIRWLYITHYLLFLLQFRSLNVLIGVALLRLCCSKYTACVSHSTRIIFSSNTRYNIYYI